MRLTVFTLAVAAATTCVASGCGRIGFTRQEQDGASPDGGLDAGPFDGGGETFDGAPPDAGPVDAGSGDAGGDAGPERDGGCGAACCCATHVYFDTTPMPIACGGSSDAARLSFESGVEGFGQQFDDGTQIPDSVRVTSDQSYAGSSAIEVTLDIPPSQATYVYIPVPATVALGDEITYRVWLTADTALDSVQGYIMDSAFSWSGSWVALANLTPGCWNEFRVPVPATFVAPFYQMGVQFIAPTAGFTGTAYIDAITW